MKSLFFKRRSLKKASAPILLKKINSKVTGAIFFIFRNDVCINKNPSIFIFFKVKRVLAGL